MADLVLYWDTGSDAGGDGTTSATSSGDNSHAYQSLNQAEAGGEQDLTAGGGNTMTFHGNRTNAGGMDDTALSFAGWTTASGQGITVIFDDFPTDGIYDNTKLVLHNNDSITSFISINEDYVHFRKLQILVTNTGTNHRRGIYIFSIGVPNSLIIDSCIIKGVCSGTGTGHGIRANDSGIVIDIFNTIVYDFISGADAGFSGIQSDDCATMNIYNCTVYGNYNGITRTLGTVTAKNCAIGNNTNDISGTVIADYNCDDDNNGTNNQSPSGGNWTNEFVTAGSDFTLKAGGNCIDNGVADLFVEDDDIIDTARPQGVAWDIGAFELVSVGVANPKGPLGHPLYGAFAGPISF